MGWMMNRREFFVVTAAVAWVVGFLAGALGWKSAPQAPKAPRAPEITNIARYESHEILGNFEAGMIDHIIEIREPSGKDMRYKIISVSGHGTATVVPID